MHALVEQATEHWFILPLFLAIHIPKLNTMPGSRRLMKFLILSVTMRHTHLSAWRIAWVISLSPMMKHIARCLRCLEVRYFATLCKSMG